VTWGGGWKPFEGIFFISLYSAILEEFFKNIYKRVVRRDCNVRSSLCMFGLWSRKLEC
jgi:hypothetical protein